MAAKCNGSLEDFGKSGFLHMVIDVAFYCLSQCWAGHIVWYTQRWFDAYVREYFVMWTNVLYHGDDAAGSDPVVHAPSPHAHVVGVLAPPEEILVPGVGGLIVHHPAAALHPARVAAAQEGWHVGAVAAALVGTASEVPILIEDDLKKNKKWRTWLLLFQKQREPMFLETPILTFPMVPLGGVQALLEMLPTDDGHMTRAGKPVYLYPTDPQNPAENLIVKTHWASNMAQRTAFITRPRDSASRGLLNGCKTIRRSVGLFFFPLCSVCALYWTCHFQDE